MIFSSEEISEFRSDAFDLLECVERGLLAIEKGVSSQTHHDLIVRSLHSLKGGAKVLEMDSFYNHIQEVENFFSNFDINAENSKDVLSLLLAAIDAARLILDGQPVGFSFSVVKQEVVLSANSTHSKPIIQLLHSSLPDFNTKAKIFAIDDDKDFLETYKMSFSLVELECETFSEPDALYEAIKNSPPDVLLTDMNMPLCSGLDVLKSVRKIDPDLPVIFVSGHLSKETLIKSLDLGVFAAIEKPFNINTLLTHVHNGAKQRRTRKYLNRSINLLLFQFKNLDSILAEHGKDDIRKAIREDMNQLIQFRRDLRQINQN